MIVAARSLGPTETLSADICIVGAGAAGITLACELDSKGMSVVLLEAGGVGLLGTPDQNPYVGLALGGHPSPSNFRRRGFGGTTTIWGGRCVPYDPIDFEHRDYVSNSGWPIDYQEVSSYYPSALEYCDAGVFDFTVAGSLKEQSPTIAGLAESAELDVGLIERYSLPTNFGKKFQAKLLRSTNVRVVTHAHALRLLPDVGGTRANVVEFADQGGKTRKVSARFFALSMGGIETARFLLASDSRGIGLGNSSDCVGRYYSCHLENVLGVVRAGKRRDVVFDFQRTRDEVYARRKIQIRDESQRRDHILNIAFRLHYPNIADSEHQSSVLSAIYLGKRLVIPEYRRILQHGASSQSSIREVARHVKNMVAGAPQLIAFGAHWTRRRLLAHRKLPYVLVANADGSFPIEFHAEQTPLRQSRISLLSDKDAHGVPRVKVDWRRSEDDVESICKAYRLLRQELDRWTTCRLDFDDSRLPQLAGESWPVGGHHIGTARMSHDRSTGVVNRDCAVHELPNLYVAGSAVFPTSSHANPTLTIVAMAIRLAAHLRMRVNA